MAEYKRSLERIIKDKDTQTYDLKNNGTFEMFSLQFGSGCYQIALYENAYSNKYSTVGIIYLNVELKNNIFNHHHFLFYLSPIR